MDRLVNRFKRTDPAYKALERQRDKTDNVRCKIRDKARIHVAEAKDLFILGEKEKACKILAGYTTKIAAEKRKAVR